MKKNEYNQYLVEKIKKLKTQEFVWVTIDRELSYLRDFGYRRWDSYKEYCENTWIIHKFENFSKPRKRFKFVSFEKYDFEGYGFGGTVFAIIVNRGKLKFVELNEKDGLKDIRTGYHVNPKNIKCFVIG